MTEPAGKAIAAAMAACGMPAETSADPVPIIPPCLERDCHA
ncbi:MAG: hypothetical protein OXH79_11460 [Boseongicola sp.]|nr:hypothetical protein [Boseongicola sp.]